MIERYMFDRLPAEPVRLKIVEWLKFHQMNPHVVCVPGWIERDPDRGAVRALCFVSVALDGGFGRVMWLAKTGPPQPRRTVVESRSEGPPLPWPVEPAEWLAGPEFSRIVSTPSVGRV